MGGIENGKPSRSGTVSEEIATESWQPVGSATPQVNSTQLHGLVAARDDRPRSGGVATWWARLGGAAGRWGNQLERPAASSRRRQNQPRKRGRPSDAGLGWSASRRWWWPRDRKSTRLNSSH